MRILLLASAYNSMTQRFHVELTYRGHDVSIELAFSDEVMTEAVERYQPDLIIAPFLKTAIPEHIWRNHLCIIIHPGIKGDRGPSSLDWAILNQETEWGVTALQADAEMDAGDIWASVNFTIQPDTKSGLYRGQVAQAAIIAILQTIERFQDKNFVPEPLNYSRNDVRGCWRDPIKQKDRAIDWTTDSTSTIFNKIRCGDSQPGVLDTIYGNSYYLYGAHPEDSLKGIPGEIIAQRHGAICRATADGAIWITHLKQKRQGDQNYFKLPAAIVLGDQVKTVPEVSLPLEIPDDCQTFQEIWYEEQNNVGYLHFDFYNGAMSTEQCQRLREAYLQARTRDTKVIVLMGGQGFWSNGIHLNVIEASTDPAAESWRNINAINDFVYELLSTDTHLTISALQGNAAAGGVMMALATDRVYARSGIILNPHYKRMGLYGSEYWTYSLPRRVGEQKAKEITDICMPMGTQVAEEIGLIDGCFGDDPIRFRQQVVKEAEWLAQNADYGNMLWLKNKKRFLDQQFKPLAEYRREELEQMSLDFSSECYDNARYSFVHKVRPSQTPLHLAKHRQSAADVVGCKVILSH